MAGVLTGVTAEAMSGNFVATVFTHSPFVGPALQMFYFYGIIAYSVHRCAVEEGLAPDCEHVLFHLLPTQALAGWLGVFLGLVYVWFFETPRLVNWEVFHDYAWRSSRLYGFAITPPNKTTGGGRHGTPWNPKTYAWTWLFFLAGSFALYSIYFYEERFLENCQGMAQLSAGAHLAVAVSFTVVAAIFLLVYLVALIYAETGNDGNGHETSIRRMPDGHRHSAILNFKYIVYNALIWTLPAVYDFWTTLQPYERWAVQWAILFGLLVIMFLTGAHLSESLSGDRYLGVVSPKRVAWALFFFWLIYGTVYIGPAISDTGDIHLIGTVASPEDALAWMGIIGGIWFVLLLFFGCICSRDPARDEADERVTKYRTAHLVKDGKANAGVVSLLSATDANDAETAFAGAADSAEDAAAYDALGLRQRRPQLYGGAADDTVAASSSLDSLEY